MIAKHISVRSALAATIGLDLAELSEYRYQSTRTPRAIYAIGEWYFTTGNEKPTWRVDDSEGMKWEEHHDRHFAQQAGTRIWRMRAAQQTRATSAKGTVALRTL